MLIDISELERGKTVESDVCIIGAGAAGITLARQFFDSDVRIVLLESRSRTRSRASRSGNLRAVVVAVISCLLRTAD